MGAQLGGPGTNQFILQPATFGMQLQAVPAAGNLNLQQPVFGGAFAGGFGGAFAGPPPPVTFGAQLQTTQLIAAPPGRGNLQLIGGRMRRPHPVADDSLQLDIVDLYRKYPAVRRRRGFSQGMPTTVLILHYVYEYHETNTVFME